MAWLFIRKGKNIVSKRTRSDIHVAELSGLDWGVITLNPQTTGLQSAGEVRQGSCIDKLTHDAGGRLSKATDQMEQTKAIGSEAGDVLVVNEVLALQAKFIILVPVAADG